ncbi:hypothetical protein [Vibrio aerogenes]|nr:hypothetical protein [Vibrio aerogenes]
MKKKKLLLIAGAFILWAYYFFPVPEPNPELPKPLLKLNQLLLNKIANSPKAYEDYWINDLSRKRKLTDVEFKMIELADQADIHRILLSSASAVYFTDYFYYYFTNRYYVYSANDYTEATQVPSIDQAIEQLEDKSIYHFCEPADHPHWFVCVSED